MFSGVVSLLIGMSSRCTLVFPPEYASTVAPLARNSLWKCKKPRRILISH